MHGIADVRLILENNGIESLSLNDGPWIRYEFRISICDDHGIYHDAGKMKASKLNICEMYRRRESLFLAFDDLSEETSCCYDILFTKKGNLKKAFWQENYGLDEWFSRDFHFLDRIEINESFKGHGFAGVVTQIYLENLANGDDVAYLKAFPLQHEEQFHDKPYGRAFEGGLMACQEKLCKYYETLGLSRIGKTPHFFFVVDEFLTKRAALKE